MKKYYFYLKNYPDWLTGGEKYQTFVFDFFRQKKENVFVFGNNGSAGFLRKSKLFRPFFGLKYIFSIPRRSVLILDNSTFLDFSLAMFLNRFWKRHFYFLIIHHLVRYDRPGLFRMKMENFYIRHSDSKITVSEITKNDMMRFQLADNSVAVIPPGLDVNPDAVPLSRVFPDKPKFLFVGNVEERKGIHFLIDALYKLPKCSFELNIVGNYDVESDYYKRLRRQIADYSLQNAVFFHGRISGDELLRFYLSSTLFVFPSIWEGYGMVVAEAMAYGLPVAASRIPAFEELIENGVTGILFEASNSKAITETLLSVYADIDILNSLSLNSLKRAKTFTSWEQTALMVLKIAENS